MALEALAVLAFAVAAPMFRGGGITAIDGTITLADGTRLAHTLIHPDGDGPWPVVLVRTPYGRTSASAAARPLAEHGCATLLQDVRGKGDSTGTFEAFRNEAADGAATFDWLLAQPFCNGQVATYGMSYLGITQWQLAPHAGPKLAAMVNQFSSADLYRDVVHFGGVQGLAISLSWLAMASGHGASVRFDHLPLIEADDASGGDLPTWDDWCRHPTLDDYWKPLDFAGRYGDVQCAALLEAGWYDLFLPGQIDDYMELARRRGPAERSFARLIVGPWDHGGPGPLPGRPDLGKDAFVAPIDEERQFLDRFLLGVANGYERKAGVRAFFLGENRWHELAGWPPNGAAATRFFLHSRGQAGAKPPGDGLLLAGKAPPRAEPADALVVDPADPCPSYAASLWTPLSTLADQAAIARRRDVLVYATLPLAQTLRIAGPIALDLWITSDAPDGDFAAKLVDVAPDGTCEWRGEGIQRARMRDGPATARLLEPGAPTLLKIRMGHIACTIAAGHRLALHVSGSNFPRFSRNLNVAEPSNVAARGVVAHESVLHDPDHASQLELWIVPTAAGSGD